MKQKVRFRHYLEYGAFRSIQLWITCFPIAWTGAFLRGVLRIVFRVCWPLKKETISRIREVFGEETSVARCRVIARTSVWNMMMNFIELFHAKKMDAAYLQKHLEGTEQAAAKIRALIDKYGGVVIALPHMGNWDLAGITCSAFNFPLMALGRPQNNPLFEAWLRRSRLNFQTVDRRHPSSFVRVAHHLKSGGVFAILPDVRHNKPAVSTTVFGKPEVQLGKGLAKFARMGNVPILPVVMERKSAAFHAVHLYDPIFPDLEADVAEDAKRITQQVWDIIEQNVREKPEQWFWHNRRWILTPLYTQTR